MPDYSIVRREDNIEQIMKKLESVAIQKLVGRIGFETDFQHLATLLQGFMSEHGTVAIFYVNHTSARSPLDNHSNILDEGMDFDVSDFKTIIRSLIGLDKGSESGFDLVDHIFPTTVVTREEVIIYAMKSLTETSASQNRRYLRDWAEEVFSEGISEDRLHETGQEILDKMKTGEQFGFEGVHSIVRILSGKDIVDLSDQPGDQENFRILADTLLRLLKGQELTPKHQKKMSSKGLVAKFLGRCIDLKKLPDGSFLYEAIRLKATELFLAYEVGLIGGTEVSRDARRWNSRLARLYREVRDEHGILVFLESAIRVSPDEATILSSDEVWGCWVESEGADRPCISHIQKGVLGQAHTWCSVMAANSVTSGRLSRDQLIAELSFTEEEISLLISGW